MNDILLCDIKPFQSCNLNCTFCHEHYRRLKNKETREVYSLYYISNYLDRSFNIIKTVLDHNDYDVVRLSLMGGELFQDRICDQYLELISGFIDSVNSICCNKTLLQVQVVSNLVYKKIDRLIDLVQNHNAYVQTSYDFVGRYTKQYQVDLFMNNVYNLVLNKIRFNVATVLHHQNIDVLTMNVKNNLIGNFNQMYNDGLNLSTVMYYNNCKKSSPLFVSDKEYQNAYTFLIDKYPHLTEFDNIRSNIVNHKIEPHHTGKIHSLSIVDKKVRYRDLTERERNYNNKFCLMCQYYKFCNTAGIYKIDTTNQYTSVCFDKIVYEKIHDQIHN